MIVHMKSYFLQASATHVHGHSHNVNNARVDGDGLEKWPIGRLGGWYFVFCKHFFVYLNKINPATTPMLRKGFPRELLRIGNNEFRIKLISRYVQNRLYFLNFTDAHVNLKAV